MNEPEPAPEPAPAPTPRSEVAAVVERYARRTEPGRYAMTQPDVWMTVQERQRQMLRLFRRLGWADLSQRSVVEVGCGAGDNLLELLRMGFAPQHLTGIELLPERYALARQRLPAAVTLIEGDASLAVLPAAQAAQADIVLQSTVFSSLLDTGFQQQLADVMWRWVRPGGGVLWYDLARDNPLNRDVRGVPARRIAALFPQGRPVLQRVTLAPPLARRLCRVHPGLYNVFNLIPVLRTHLLAWVGKPLLAPQRGSSTELPTP